IDDESLPEPSHVDLVRAEQIDELDLAVARGIEHGFDVEPAFAGDESEIEPANPGGGGVQHIESVPAEIRFDCAHRLSGLGGKREDGSAIGTGKGCLPQDQHWPLSALELIQEGMLAIGDLGQGLRASAEIIVSVGEIDALTDEPDRYVGL